MFRTLGQSWWLFVGLWKAGKLFFLRNKWQGGNLDGVAWMMKLTVALKKWWFPIGICWTPGVDFQGLYMLVSGRVKEPPFGMMLMYVDA